jgi:hypothetical protein
VTLAKSGVAPQRPAAGTAELGRAWAAEPGFKVVTLGHGPDGSGSIPGGATRIFAVELLAIAPT